jgi:hypothetical protein
VSKAAKASLPSLAASTAALIRGETFTAAAKHAEAVKQLASTWEALRKLLGAEWSESLGAEGAESIKEACIATHNTAVNPKASRLFQAIISRFCGILLPGEV